MNLFLRRLNEPQRRWYVGLLSQQPDSPSERQLAKITGLDEKTIRRGRQELEAELVGLPHNRQRREGGGRPRAEKKTRSQSQSCWTSYLLTQRVIQWVTVSGSTAAW